MTLDERLPVFSQTHNRGSRIFLESNRIKFLDLFNEAGIVDLNEEGILPLRTNIDSKEFVFDETKFNVLDIIKLLPNESIIIQTEVLDLNLQEVLLVKDKTGDKYE